MDAEDAEAPARINRSVINVPGIRGMEEIWQPMLYTPRPAPTPSLHRDDGSYDFLLFVRSFAAGIVTPSVNDDAVSFPRALILVFAPTLKKLGRVVPTFSLSPSPSVLPDLFDDYIFPIIYIYARKIGFSEKNFKSEIFGWIDVLLTFRNTHTHTHIYMYVFMVNYGEGYRWNEINYGRVSCGGVTKGGIPGKR